MTNGPGPRLTDLAASLPDTVPFVGPETQERTRGAPFIARLGANESLFGPSPKALAAMQRASRDIWKYGDPETYDLRHALAAHYGIGADHIVIGEGIDGLLGYLVRLLVAPGDAVVTSDGAYPTFNYHVAGFGGTLHKVPYAGDHEDPEALVSKAKEVDAKLIYLANPDNPMGSWHAAAALEKMIEDLPDGCLLALDEAYVELAPRKTAPDIAPDNPRVIRLRTFSKAYGMAGARVGYAMGATPLIRAFDKVRNHFGVNRIAQAGALAALEDQSHLRWVIGQVETSRKALNRIADANGLTALPSATNFVTMDCGLDGTFARAVLAELTKSGIFARMPFVAPQDRAIRISCGPGDAMRAFDNALPAALAKAREVL
ncbi:pyridoxal phosphate-dependent aminotransferase [Litoreibacter roseus]|uniref:histidinol-phosphate transaminase n=1 Tax=Litoreibacter roseus TaxID=2601869 RepID=A0A6N6JBM5_9RHOB|nr:pyridoxal phosphate-dependent aminotransferase [Litoreibacter roseus]GFE63464.1 histidinol-phosphate aminotransferase [Litoreibacter roseus]